MPSAALNFSLLFMELIEKQELLFLQLSQSNNSQ